MIDAVEHRSFVRQRKDVFRISTGSSDMVENVFVKVTCGDDFGVGAGAPSSVTNETLASMESFLAKVPKRLVGTDEADLAKLHQRLDAIADGNTAAKAAVDIAVLDLLSKRERKPLYEYLGGSRERNRMLTDMTIGIESIEVTVAKALRYYKEGFRALKLKVGLDMESDVRRVAAVREAVGPKVELRVDANQGYTVEQAIRFAHMMRPLDVEFIEQPVDASDYAALRAVTASSPVPIMADECVKSCLDARRMAREGIASLVNIKLMKCGGIHEGVQTNRFAEAAGIHAMVGCMGEMQVSVAAALHFALSSDNVVYADLDSHLMVVDDPSSGLVLRDGHLIAPKGPGLGMSTPLDS